MTAIFKDTWQINELGHVAAHNQIARRLNRGIDATDFGVGPLASASVNHAGIAAACSKLVSIGGGTLHLPPGTLDIDNPISLPGNVSLKGAGILTTRLRAQAAVSSVVSIIGTTEAYKQGCLLEDLTIHANSAAETGVYFKNASYHNALRRVRVMFAPGTGVDLADWGCLGIVLDGCEIDHCGRGVVLGIAANMTRLLCSAIHDNDGAGLWAESATNTKILSTVFEHSGLAGLEQSAIVFRGGHNQAVDSCYFEGNGGGAGLDIDIAPGEYYPGLSTTCDGTVIIAPYLNGSTTCAVHAIQTDGCKVAVVGGKSNLHSGPALHAINGGSFETLGFVSVDEPQS